MFNVRAFIEQATTPHAFNPHNQGNYDTKLKENNKKDAVGLDGVSNQHVCRKTEAKQNGGLVIQVSKIDYPRPHAAPSLRLVLHSMREAGPPLRQAVRSLR